MPSKLDPYKPLIDTRLKEYPKLTAVRLFKEVRAAGYPGSYNQVKRYVRKVRPMKAVVIEDGRYDDGALVENPEFMRYAYHWNFRIRACRPYRAQTKGKVERPIRYLRESFFYGRTFTSDDDLNAQALHWLETEANVRSHATLKERPLDRFERERLLLEPLATRPYHPLVLPPDRSSPGTTSPCQPSTSSDVPSRPMPRSREGTDEGCRSLSP